MLIARSSLRWKKYALTLAFLLIGVLISYNAYFYLLKSINDRISRCDDESAAEYIQEKDQRMRECK